MRIIEEIKKMEAFPRHPEALKATRELLEHIQSMAVEAELVEVHLPIRDVARWLKEAKSSAWGGQKIRLTGHDFDEVRVSLSFGERSAGGYRICYTVQGSAPEPGKKVKAKTNEIKEHKFWGRVLSIKWTGGEIAQSLNHDTDLNRKLIESGQTRIKIRPDQKRQFVEIMGPLFSTMSEALPSRAAFEAYSTIAKHIHNRLESQETN